MSGDPDPDAELLARFAALKAPSLQPGSTDAALAAARARADAEDRELADIAAGRLPDVSSGPSGNLPGDAGTQPPPPPSTAPGPSLASPAVSGSGGVASGAHVPLDGAHGEDHDAIRNYVAENTGPAKSPFSNDISALARELDPARDRERDIALEVADALKVADGARRRASAASERRRSEAGEEGEGEDLETEDEIVQRALDAARLEAKAEAGRGSDDDGESSGDHATSSTPAADAGSGAGGRSTAGGAGGGSSLGGAPSGAEALLSLPALPQLPALADEQPMDADEKARMDALLGLRGPSAFPATPSRAPKDGGPGPAPAGFSFPGMQSARDGDLDSWCGICNKDATVQCTDCDGELYCPACWREHREEDPDHRGKKFVWARPQQ